MASATLRNFASQSALLSSLLGAAKLGRGTLHPGPIIELRQYTLHPGKRDTLIDLFEREFIEGQEAVGMTLIGQFRDLDDPDRFVWMRAFKDMPARADSLQRFYCGPVWQADRERPTPR